MSTPLLDLTQIGMVAHEAGVSGGTPTIFELGTKVRVGSQPNRRMLAYIGNFDGGNITDNQLDTSSGAHFTFLGRRGHGGFGPIEAWYLDNPAPGDHTICPTSAAAGFVGIAILEPWYNVDLTIPPVWGENPGEMTIDVDCSATQAVSCALATYAGSTPTCTDGTLTAQYADTSGPFDQLVTARKLGVSPLASFAFADAGAPNIMAVVLSVASGGTGKLWLPAAVRRHDL